MPNQISNLSTSAKEFCNANLSKAYPLAYMTGGEAGTLPSSFLADATILIDGVDQSEVVIYIKQVEVFVGGVYLSFAAEYEGNEVSFDRAVFIPADTELFSKISFTAASGAVSMYGVLRVGHMSSIMNWPQSTELTATNGKIDETAIENVSGLFVSGISVGEEILTGDVVLEAGDGIELDVSGNTITISNTRYLAGSTVLNDSALLAEALSVYGAPVRSICGITPDASGNISIVVPATENDNYHFIRAQGTDTSGSIVLSIAKDPCIYNDTIENIMSNVQQLNIRCSRLDEGIKALDNSLNNISIQLARLD